MSPSLIKSGYATGHIRPQQQALKLEKSSKADASELPYSQWFITTLKPCF